MTDAPNTDPALPPDHAPWAPADLPQAEFVDHGPIAGEPPTDVRIVVAGSGTPLRERLVLTAADADATLAAGKAQPTSRTITISNALLDADGKVVVDAAGQPLLSTRHELLLTNDQLGRLGEEGLEAAVLEARRQAAALADRQFAGAKVYAKLLAARATPPAAQPVPAPPAVPEEPA